MKVNASTILGQTLRQLREAAGLSQEKLAEQAGITYQYLSSVENGKENFTIGILESLARALGVSVDALVDRAFAAMRPLPTVDRACFVRDAILPPGLSQQQVEASLNETQHIVRLINMTLMRSSGRPLSEYIQGNNFSGIISNILTDAFSRLTPYKHNHAQRYPDLMSELKEGIAGTGLEVKTTIQRGKGGESHNGHSGWHIVACYEIDKATGDVQFIHVMFADLVGHDKRGADWKYLGSKVNKKTGSQRTETYVTTPAGTAKLRHGTVYLDTSRVNISKWRTHPAIQPPAHSPFRIARKTPAKRRRAG